MLKTIRINSEVVEMMIFFWESIVAKDKVQDGYLIEVAGRAEMKPLYGEEFDEESVRKVLSAMVNRELINNATKKESRFWNNNMWMTEDLSLMQEMVAPIKTLNLDDKKELFKDSRHETIEVRFIPGHADIYYIEDNVLTINFFSLMTDFAGGFKIDGMPYEEFVVEKMKELG